MSKQIYMNYPNGKRKALTLSYDDGCVQDIRLVEILDRYGLKGTFNLNSGTYFDEQSLNGENVSRTRRMTEAETTALFRNSGHEVAVHTVKHPRLEILSPTNITYEVLQDRLNLEHQFGCIVRGMAYPYGTLNEDVVACLRACGIAYSRTTVSTHGFGLPTDWLRLPATCHHEDSRLFELADRFLKGTVVYNAQLFYLWGHSYEFEDNNNWNVIEEFAALMGGREDLWYATNIEIYDYVQDFNRLIWAVDESIVHNPTNRTLFFRYGKEEIALAAGETRHLPD